jgi:curved DNA-binding protein CbpA
VSAAVDQLGPFQEADVAEAPSGSDPYEVLGIVPTADGAEIARAYRRRLREVHPDTAKEARDSPEATVSAELRAIQQAYVVLRDPAERARYDAERAATSTTRPSHSLGIPVPVRVRTRPARVRERLFRAGPARVEPLPPRPRESS